MTSIYRKGPTSTAARRLATSVPAGLLKGIIIVSGIATLAVSASAQGAASAYSNITYSFGNVSGLSVTDNGEDIYNLISPFAPAPSAYYSPYTSSTGTGVATTSVDPTTGYTSYSGYNGAGSNAMTAGAGTAAASVGSQENLVIQNNNTFAIQESFDFTVYVSGSVSTSGTSTATDYEHQDTYVGFNDFSLTTFTEVSNSFFHLTGTNSSGSPVYDLQSAGSWSSLGGGYYSGSYDATLAAGEKDSIGFYASGDAFAAVPTPPGLAVLGVGLMGLLLKRRKRA